MLLETHPNPLVTVGIAWQFHEYRVVDTVRRDDGRQDFELRFRPTGDNTKRQRPYSHYDPEQYSRASHNRLPLRMSAAGTHA